METKKKIEKIISEIEKTNATSINADKKTTEEVVEILLGYNNIEEYEQIKNDTGFNLDLNDIAKNKEKNNILYDVSYYHDIINRRKVVGGIITFFRKIIRRILKFLFEPILKEQNDFNASVTASINALLNSAIVIQGFIDYNQNTILKADNNSMEEKFQELLDEKIHKITTFYNQKIEVLEHELEERDKIVEQKLEKELEQRDKIVEQKLERELEQRDKIVEQITNDYSNQIEATQINLYQKSEEFDLKIMQTEINFLKALKKRNPEIEEKLVNTVSNSIDENEDLKMDYFKFENTFRGSRNNIMRCQEYALEYFKNKGVIIDLGCGRGEFLELMKKNNIKAVGVDIYQDFVDYCNIKQLEVYKGDALEYLQGLENEAIGGIFCSQVIEHLEFSQVITLCKLAFKKLMNGSCIVLETPNPKCLSIFSNSFYVDPSHNKPMHPETMQYILRDAGFQNIKIIYTDTSKVKSSIPVLEGSGIVNLSEFNQSISDISDLLFGSQDYAIIAYK